MARSRFDNLDDETQDEIIRTAGEEFADNGYERASLNAIIEKAGISKGSLYYYFENKEDLFATVVEKASMKLWSHAVGFTLDDLTADNFWGEIERIAKQAASYASGHRWYFRLARTFYRLRDEKPGTLRDSAIYEVPRRWAGRIIERGQDLGVIRTDLPREYLVELILAIGEASDRWFLEHFDDQSGVDLERETDRQVDVFRRVLEPKEQL